MEVDNLILEHLRAIRSKLDRLEDGQREIVDKIIALRMREHAQDGDINRHERDIAHPKADIERIKRRLDLVDDK